MTHVHRKVLSPETGAPSGLFRPVPVALPMRVLGINQLSGCTASGIFLVRESKIFDEFEGLF